jgi:hypothetical protein
MVSASVRYCVILTRSPTSKPAVLSASQTLLQACSACSSKPGAIDPSGAIPGVPEIASQRAPGATSTASL